jgi:hypothetical protein
MAELDGNLLVSFLLSPSWSNSRYLLVLHPELLEPAVDEMVEALIASGRRENDALRVAVFEQQLDLLRHCRQGGLDTAFAELSGRRRVLILADDQDMVREQAEDAQRHYERTGDVRSLDLALELWTQIYTELEDPAAVRRVIAALKEGINRAQPDSTIQFVRIAALGYASFRLFTLTRETEELDNLSAVGRSIPVIEHRLRALESSGADDPVLRELYSELKRMEDSFDQMRGT